MAEKYLTDQPIGMQEWHRLKMGAQTGASVEFLGIARGQEAGQPIQALDYEAYEPMAERVIVKLIDQARQRWPLNQVYVRHRIGRVPVGEAAVLVGVHAPHRDEAFMACRFLIDALKRDAPIWKQAIAMDGTMLEAACTHGNTTH